GGAAIVPDIGADNAAGHAQHRAHTIQIVDHAAGEHMESPFDIRGHVTDSIAAGCITCGAGGCDHLGGDVIKAPNIKLAHVQVVVGVEMIDLHKANVLHPIDFTLSIFVSWVVDLHVANLGHCA